MFFFVLLPSKKPFKHVFTEADLAVVYKVLNQAGANNLVNLMMRTFEMEERNRIMMNKNYHDMQNHIRQDNQGIRDFRISLQQQLLQQQSQQQLGGANAAVLHQV